MYIDFSKTFDSITQTEFTQKLDKIGLNVNRVNCIRCYLSGILQGSFLGILLFLIYTNDLVKSITHSHTFLYADDSKLTKIISSLNDCLLLQSNLNALVAWYMDWQLIVNIVKCVFMSLHLSFELFYYVNDVALSQFHTFKDLDFTYSSVDLYNKEIVNIFKSAKYILHLIFCIFHILLHSVYVYTLQIFVSLRCK